MTKAKPTQSPAHADISALSYEQARDELINVVAQLETGSQPLDEAMQLWERGEVLAQHCEQWLDGARERLAEVKQRAQERAGTNSADAGEA